MNVPEKICVFRGKAEDGIDVLETIDIISPKKLEGLILEEIERANHNGKFPARVLIDQEWLGSGLPEDYCGVPLFEAFGLPVVLVFGMKRYYPFDGVEVIS